MTRVDASFPEPLADLLDAAIEDGHFKGTSDAARVSLREYFDDDTRLEAVKALVEAHPPDKNDPEALTGTDVVRLTGRLPPELPDDLRDRYDFPTLNQDDTESESTTTGSDA